MPPGNRRCGWPWKESSTAAITIASPPWDNPSRRRPACPLPPTGPNTSSKLNDLPLEGLSQLHVRFDLMGKGEVWVNDVQLYDLHFNEMELHALYKLITLADATLQNGQIGDCLKLLGGYWPRFLDQHVSPAPDAAGSGAIAAKPPEGTPPKQEPPQQTGLMDRVKNMLPDKLRF